MNAAPPPASQEAPADVLVVGFGPVGQVLSILLAQRGWQVTVVERWPRPYPMPRAVAFDADAARILDAAGVGPHLSTFGEPSEDYVVVDAAGRTLLRIGLGHDPAHRWPASTSMYQPGLEEALERRAQRIPNLRLLRGHEAVRLAARDTGADLTVRRAAGGPERVLRARWVVGCDGANSMVREAMGAELSDGDFALDWMACDVTPHRAADFPPCNVQIADPARPRVAVSAGPGHRRWEFMRLPGEFPDTFGTAENAWRLLGLFGVEPGTATLERHAVYTLTARNADRWRAGRVLLAGDAAHQMPPFAGQGMCSGLRDAEDLAWKLDRVLAGAARPEALDSYEAERRPHTQASIDRSVALGRMICLTDPVAAAHRDNAMAVRPDADVARPAQPGVHAPEGGLYHRGDDGTPGPGAGLPVPPSVLGAAGHLGPDPVLLTADDPAALHGFGLPACAERWRLRLRRLRPGDAVDDLLRAWLESLGATAAVIRPDCRVYGLARNPAETEALLRELADRYAPSLEPRCRVSGSAGPRRAGTRTPTARPGAPSTR
ncbi:bifunctional 3-(3-hydroxy-phenyl)propionate/3-hydroxycinnamic acid hydroxylase [Streptomyces sp. MUM 16J]|uniref:bifunctional 3-(3-hydroxy-phenyl)propionate/3-hydroxycinnamic acid hydroxylase MhpA n=1 Tax=Streptomyces sp. MUM 16J TaxID=2791988 RepID=UPI001F045F7B|nr:bifunctional 3-(3-hydroxy-phenyl)propionate/3-hydroxycinnamic acid hydroxylase [Streptomyces sp. MUM 16J]MCH0559363.1 bifunctional 3-(3-hydroxy-phenyl)propionate/3-hydroxycinnamic acid hydroxylase [Streptomyces sp. MUM 16J]